MNKGRELIKRVSLISLVISALVILVIPVFDHEKKEDDITAPSSSVDYKRINVRQSDGTFPGLNDPISTTTSTDTSWNGSCVYLGEYDGNPITWHVLDAYTTDYNTEGKSTIFMYASRSVTEGKSFDFDNNSNWSISSLHNFLNGTDSSSFLNKFTNFEQNLIIPSTKTVIGTGHSMPTIDGKDAVYAPLSGDKVFLLDASEVGNLSYGFWAASTRIIKDVAKEIRPWWLRSAIDSNKAVYIDKNGEFKSINSSATSIESTSVGIVPAMNITLDNVIFTSSKGYKASAVLGDGIDKPNSTNWTLTIQDDDQKIELGGEIVRTIDDCSTEGSVTIPYKYTKNTEDTSLNANRLSIMITTSDGTEVVHYGKVSTDSDLTDGVLKDIGSITFNLPNDYKSYNHKVYLVAEKVNADYYTDYAAKPLELHIPYSVEISSEYTHTYVYNNRFKQSCNDQNVLLPAMAVIPESGYYMPLTFGGTKLDNGIVIARKSRDEISISGKIDSDKFVDICEHVQAKMLPDKNITTNKVMNLGVANLYTYDVDNKKDKLWDNSTGNKVYFGKYGDTPTSVLYRVLEADTSGVLLDCDSVLFNKEFNKSKSALDAQTSNNGNEWNGSSLYTYLNSSDFIDNSSYFTPVEKSLIVENRSVDSYNYSTSTYPNNDNVNVIEGKHKDYTALDKIYVLNAQEASRYYDNSNARDKGGDWWLRSANSQDNTKASYVKNGAIYSDKDVTDNVGVSPAFKINAENILYTTASKPSTNNIEFVQINNNSGTNTWKFTLIDSKIECYKRTRNLMQVTENGGKYTLKFGYRYKDFSDKTPTQISAIITDGDRTKAGTSILYYGKVADIPSDSKNKKVDGDMSITLPADYNFDKYRIYIFAEVLNAEGITDYASLPYELIPTKETEKPSTIVYKNNAFYANSYSDDAYNINITEWCRGYGLTATVSEGVATITMNNFNFTTSGGGRLLDNDRNVALHIYGKAVINIEGSNTIKLENIAYIGNKSNNCIRAEDDITFKGTGVLDVYCKEYNGHAIYVSTGKNMNIESGTINAYGGAKGSGKIASNRNIGRGCAAIALGDPESDSTNRGALTISGGTVNTYAEGESTFESVYRGKAIRVYGNMNILGGTINAYGDGVNGCGIDVYSSLNITGGNITTRGGNDNYYYDYCSSINAYTGINITGGTIETVIPDSSKIKENCEGNGIMLHNGLIRISQESDSNPTKITARAYGINGRGIGTLFDKDEFNTTIDGSQYDGGSIVIFGGDITSYGGEKGDTAGIYAACKFFMVGGKVTCGAPKDKQINSTNVTGKGIYALNDIKMYDGLINAYGYGYNGKGLETGDDLYTYGGEVIAYTAWNTISDIGEGSAGLLSADDMELHSGKVKALVPDTFNTNNRIRGIVAFEDVQIGCTTCGKAYIEAYGHGARGQGIKAEDNIDIHDGEVKAYSGTKGLCSSIKAENILTINNGNVKALVNSKFVKSESSDRSKGINSDNEIIINGGTIEAYGIGSNGSAIIGEKKITIKGGDITAKVSGSSGRTIYASAGDLVIEDGIVKAYGGTTNDSNFAATIYGEWSVGITGGKVYAYRPEGTYDDTKVTGYGIYSRKTIQIHSAAYVESYGYGKAGIGIYNDPSNEDGGLCISNGTVKAYGGTNGEDCIGIAAGTIEGEDGVMQIEGGIIYAIAPYTDDYQSSLTASKRGKGIYAKSTLGITGGNIETYGFGPKGKGIDSFGALSISGGNIKAHGGTSGENNAGIESDNSITITGGNMLAGPVIEGIIESNITSSFGVFSHGNISIEGENTVVDAQVYGSTSTGIYSKVNGCIKGGTINVSSKSENTFNKHYGIRGKNSLNISGGIIDVKINSNGEKIYGIFAGSVDSLKDVNISGGKVYVDITSTTATDLLNAGILAEKLTVSGGSVVCKATGNYVRGIYVTSAISVTSGQVKCQGKGGGIGCADEVTGITLDTTTNPSTKDYTTTCVITASTNFDGSLPIEVSEFNFSNIHSYKYIVIGTLYSGPLEYNARNNQLKNAFSNEVIASEYYEHMGIDVIPVSENNDTDILVLNGFCIESGDSGTALKIIGGDIIIKTTRGTVNRITNKGNEQVSGISSDSDITLEGEGKLEVLCLSPTNTSSIGIVSNKNISINSGIYNIYGTKIGIKIGDDSNLYMANATATIETSSGGNVIITGSNSKVNVHQSIKGKKTSSDNMSEITDFNATYSSYEYVEMIPSIISVEITWGSLEYNCSKKWKTDRLEYDYIWTTEDELDKQIKINNTDNSNIPIKADVAFTQYINTITATFDKTSDTIKVGETLTSNLTIDGTLSDDFINGTEIGQVTVTLSD